MAFFCKILCKDLILYDKQRGMLKSTPQFLIKLTVVATATVVVIAAAYEDDYKKDNPFAAAVVAKIKTAHESFASFLPSLIVYERQQIWLLKNNKYEKYIKIMNFLIIKSKYYWLLLTFAVW